MSDKVQELIEGIKSLTLLEAKELADQLKEEFGIEAAMPMAVGAVAAPAAGEAAAEEEQTEFTVKLTAIGDKKIQVIKAVREVTSLGLKEAKDLVESAPVAVVENVSKEEAEKVKAAIEDAGGQADIV